MSENYFIDTELSSGHLVDAMDFIREYYLLPQPDAFKNVTKSTSNGSTILSYTATDKEKLWEVKVDIAAKNPFQVTMTPINQIIPDVIKTLKEELFIIIQLFEDTIRQSTLYFAWVEGKDIIPEEAPTERKKVSIRIFGSNMILIYLLFFGVNIILFLLLGIVAAIIAILILQLVIVLLSDRILSRTSDWKITPENPRVHILEYQLPLEDFQKFQKKYGKDIILKMKNEIYQKSLAVGQQPSCELGEDVFLEIWIPLQRHKKKFPRLLMFTI